MTALWLVEKTVELVESIIKANITAALAEVSLQRADNLVGLESPYSYFRFPSAMAFRAPAVFTIAEEMNFRLPDGQNFISASARISVAIICEDKDHFLLTQKVWRYQAALTKVLWNTQVLSSDGQVKIVCKVVRNTFSSIFPRDRREDSQEEVFRKEVVCDLEVEHYENIEII